MGCVRGLPEVGWEGCFSLSLALWGPLTLTGLRLLPRSEGKKIST